MRGGGAVSCESLVGLSVVALELAQVADNRLQCAVEQQCVVEQPNGAATELDGKPHAGLFQDLHTRAVDEDVLAGGLDARSQFAAQLVLFILLELDPAA